MSVAKIEELLSYFADHLEEAPSSPLADAHFQLQGDGFVSPDLTLTKDGALFLASFDQERGLVRLGSNLVPPGGSVEVKGDFGRIMMRLAADEPWQGVRVLALRGDVLTWLLLHCPLGVDLCNSGAIADEVACREIVKPQEAKHQVSRVDVPAISDARHVADDVSKMAGSAVKAGERAASPMLGIFIGVLVVGILSAFGGTVWWYFHKRKPLKDKMEIATSLKPEKRGSLDYARGPFVNEAGWLQI